MIRSMSKHNITNDTMKIKRFTRKSDAQTVARDMNSVSYESRKWVVSKPSVKNLGFLNLCFLKKSKSHSQVTLNVLVIK